MSEWISVKTRMPEPCVQVLFLFRGAHFGVGRWSGDDSAQWLDDLSCDRDGEPCDLYEVTHWMPLPLPPQIEGFSGGS